ncbi:MAG: exodeoxyribonuclease VII large subunit, partial [Pseudomonadota bacterium]
MAQGDLLNWQELADEESEGGGLERIQGSPLSVTAASALVRRQIEALGSVCVVGEITEPKLHSSGHFYANLKDEGAMLALVAWRSTVVQWEALPKAGSLVEVRGKLTSYPARSSYQITASKITLAGVGTLLQQIEALKAKLMSEGVFEASRKRALPFLPRRIGIITSPTGAVLHDMLHRLEARCPREVVFVPVAVQGPEAAGQVAAALAALNDLPLGQKPDVIIVARGGGSLHDLMPFNDERLVRAVAASDIPVVSGVGHEPDVTLCDFAADVRAPTPTAAAEMVVPVCADVLLMLAGRASRMQRATANRLALARQQVALAARGLPDPHRQLLQGTQRLEETMQRLVSAGPVGLKNAQQQVAQLARVLEAHHPEAPLKRG